MRGGEGREKWEGKEGREGMRGKRRGEERAS